MQHMRSTLLRLLILLAPLVANGQGVHWSRSFTPGAIFTTVIASPAGDGSFFAIGIDSMLSGPAADVLVAHFDSAGREKSQRTYGLGPEPGMFRATEIFDG